jgi:cytochrome c biogenesis protein
VTLAPERLSTAPEPVAPPSPGTSLRAAARRTWRQLTSMRTALLLLFLLALAAVPGAHFPQRGQSPVRVNEYYAEHPALAPWLDRLSLFDVYAAPWFAAIYLLLFVSLVGCLVPRIRLHARALRTPPPKVPAQLSRLAICDRWSAAAPPQAAADAAARALRRGRWRVVRRDGAAGAEVCAEKGYLRETGNLLFHVSLVALLVGVATGGLFGFQGTVLVKEGEGFANTVLSYDDHKPGRRFREGDLVPFHFRLDDFRASFSEGGRPVDFEADLRWAADADGELQPYRIRVNEPLSVDGARLYLLGHGYAPHVLVRDVEGEVVLDQAVPCLPQDLGHLSTCVIKVPDAAGEQLAFEGVFTPTTVQDPETGRVGSRHPALQDPALTLVAYRGDLGLDSGIPASVYSLGDKERLEPVDEGRAQLLDPGATWELPGGGSLTYVGTSEWANFQITQDPGKLLALGASVGMVLGLCLSLFVRRRRVWVRASAGPDGRTVVEAGGLGRTDAEAFRTEFAGLVERLRDDGSLSADEQPAAAGREEVLRG